MRQGERCRVKDWGMEGERGRDEGKRRERGTGGVGVAVRVRLWGGMGGRRMRSWVVSWG